MSQNYSGNTAHQNKKSERAQMYKIYFILVGFFILKLTNFNKY